MKPTRTALLALLWTVAIGCSGSSPEGQADPRDIWIAELVTSPAGDLRVGTARNLTRRPGYDSQPAFLPDGASFLFASDRDGGVHVWRYDLGSGAIERLTDGAGRDYSPESIPGHVGFSAVRVDEWGRQRLWRFGGESGEPRPIFEWEEGVRDYAWIDSSIVALGILDDEGGAELRFGDPLRGWVEDVAVVDDIGRTLCRVPGENAISIELPAEDGSAQVAIVDLLTRTTRLLIPLPQDAAGHAWSPDGALFTASGSRLLRFRPELDDGWQEIGNVADSGVRRISRLVIDRGGERLLFVASLADDTTLPAVDSP